MTKCYTYQLQRFRVNQSMLHTISALCGLQNDRVPSLTKSENNQLLNLIVKNCKSRNIKYSKLAINNKCKLLPNAYSLKTQNSF